MNLSIGKVILILAAIGFALAILNFFLVSKFNQTSGSSGNGSKTIFSLFSNTIMDFSNLDIDSLGEYRIQTNFIKGTAESIRGANDVAMVTHCTPNHLHYLLNMVEHWQGFISVAVVVPGLNIITAYKTVIGLHLCNNKIKQRVTFHIVYPLSHPSLVNKLMTHVKSARKALPKSCVEFLLGIQSGSAGITNYANIKIPYPNNLLRNVARHSVNSDYIFMVDIDMMCNANLYSGFLKFAEQNHLFGSTKDKMVFVVPAFESENDVPVGTQKETLMTLWDSGKVQPFYFKACWKCQRPTNYEQWKRHKSKSNGVEISHTVEWTDPWEPFYIGPKDVPLYDERFNKYGFNRISQVCETNIAGYNFAVLDNAFLVHHGLKRNFHKNKEKENDRNRDLFRQFKRELKTKYPASNRRC
ncbi:hypothetical protein QZH41_014722 [Actinostola sp. cb2023]|nr:hypothetical protein QZH41_014722 [Actinostola sp. cb2023]